MLWRRAGAFCVDYFVASLLALALLIPLAHLFPIKIALGDTPAYAREKQCIEVDAVPESLVKHFRSKPWDQPELCETISLFFTTTRTIEAIVYKTYDRNTNYWVIEVVRIDSEGSCTQAIQPFFLASLLVLVLGSAYLMRLKHQSPGKYLFGIEVTGTGCILCREVRRTWALFPYAIYSLVRLTFHEDYRRYYDEPYQHEGLGYLLGLLPFLVYLWVLLWRRFPAPWNASTGFTVVWAKTL